MNNMKLPVGIDQFDKLIKSGFYYVDKTRLIEQLLQNWGEVNLFTRPRRFGKTLNMSMLKSFFEIGADKTLFDQLYIAANKELCEEHMGQYPVIFLSLKGVDGLNFEEAKSMLKITIRTEAQRHYELKKSEKVSEENRKLFNDILSGQDERIEDSLRMLSQILFEHYGKKSIILIDEYDVPLDKAFQHGYYKEMVSLLRGLFGQALKTNEFLQFAVLTGCLRVSKESIFTGVNNFSTSSVISKNFNKYFGFTEEDVQRMLKDFGALEQYPLVKEWYDGYNFGGIDMYCPWDVTCYVMDYVRNKKITPSCYWSGSSDNAIIRAFIDKYRGIIKTDFEKLLNGKTVNKKVSLNQTYGELQGSVDNFWSVLLLSGYLTIEKDDDYYNTVTEDGGVFALRIPNTEVKEIFINTINRWMESATGRVWDASNLINAIWKKDVDVMSKEITGILRKTISYFDYSESFYHAFLAGILSGAGQVVKTNPETGEGRSDIVMEDSDNSRIVIFELKRTKKKEEMRASCEQALKQIEEVGYMKEFIDDYDEIICYGISFYKKTCLVKTVD